MDVGPLGRCEINDGIGLTIRSRPLDQCLTRRQHLINHCIVCYRGGSHFKHFQQLCVVCAMSGSLATCARLTFAVRGDPRERGNEWGAQPNSMMRWLRDRHLALGYREHTWTYFGRVLAPAVQHFMKCKVEKGYVDMFRVLAEDVVMCVGPPTENIFYGHGLNSPCGMKVIFAVSWVMAVKMHENRDCSRGLLRYVASALQVPEERFLIMDRQIFHVALIHGGHCLTGPIRLQLGQPKDQLINLLFDMIPHTDRIRVCMSDEQYQLLWSVLAATPDDDIVQLWSLAKKGQAAASQCDGAGRGEPSQPGPSQCEDKLEMKPRFTNPIPAIGCATAFGEVEEAPFLAARLARELDRQPTFMMAAGSAPPPTVFQEGPGPNSATCVQIPPATSPEADGDFVYETL